MGGKGSGRKRRPVLGGDDGGKRSRKLAKPKKLCAKNDMSSSGGFTRCACVTRHDECEGQKAEGGIWCRPCQERVDGWGFEHRDRDRQADVMAVRDKYMDDENLEGMTKLEFDDATGAPVVDERSGVADIDQPDLSYGLRYISNFVKQEEASKLREQARELDRSRSEKKRWHDDKRMMSQKQWWFWNTLQLETLKETYEKMLTYERDTPGEEAAWVSHKLSSVGEPACGNALDKLFNDEAPGKYKSAGVSVNYQHECFVPHTDSWVNGGYGNAIATISESRGATAKLFSSKSGRGYCFGLEPRSCWGMRGEVMKDPWAHSVDAESYPKNVRTNTTSAHMPGDCTCRISYNFRGISTEHEADLDEELQEWVMQEEAAKEA